MTKDEFAKRLYKLMTAKGWHQAELARRAALSRNSISTYIGAHSFPSSAALDRLARALKMTADELLPGHTALPLRGDLPADVLIKVLPDDPTKAFVTINRIMPLIVAAQIVGLIANMP